MQDKTNQLLRELQQLRQGSLLKKIEEMSTEESSSIQDLVQESLIDVCQKFIKENEKFYGFCKKVERKSEECLNELVKVEKYLKLKTRVELGADLARVSQRFNLNQQRRKAVQQIQQLFEMPSSLKQFFQKDSESQELLVAASQYVIKRKTMLQNLRAELGESADYSIITQAEDVYRAQSNITVSRALKKLKSLKTDIEGHSLIDKYSDLFHINEEIWQNFKQAYISWRTEIIKSVIWPKTVPLDYSLQLPLEKYTTDLFQLIEQQYEQEKKLAVAIFPSDSVMSRLWPEPILHVYSRLQRNFLKCNDLLSLVSIKAAYERHAILKNNESNVLNSSLTKIIVCIESQLKNQTDKLTQNKYNIYSVSSYLIVSDYLKKAYNCYILKGQRELKQPVQSAYIQPFIDLCNTRKPDQSNKSLIIFNINIWKMYQDVWQSIPNITDGKTNMLTRCQTILQQCKNTFMDINLKDVKSKFMNFDTKDKSKMIQGLMNICSSDIKKCLHAELSLIIHPEIKEELKKQLNLQFLQQYANLFRNTNPMSNTELKALCSQLKINIKALGKAADTVKIMTVQEMEAVLSD